MTLHYDRLGHGPHTLLAFHGVCQTGRGCFLPFVAYLSDYYTIYAFDLVHHGKSVQNDEPFSDHDVVTKAGLTVYLRDFLVENRIGRFDVVGFSIGGRFALATAEAFPSQLDRLLLIAPDGVVEHPLYRLATRYGPTRWLYRTIIHQPEPLFALADLGQKVGLIPKSTVNFTRYMLATPESRQVIYRSWVSFRKLSFAMPALYATLRAERVRVWLFMGKHDAALPVEKLKSFADLLPREQCIILEASHARLVERTAHYLLEVLK